MRKAIFLDRDGTINVEKDYIFKIEDLEFESGSVEALKDLKKMGYLLIVITNQSGIARGYFTEEDLHRFNEGMNKILKENNAGIDRFYFCPHHLKSEIKKYARECECRKPNNGLIEEAIAYYGLDRANSYMIGDKYSDIQAGIKSGLKTILVKTGYGKNEENKINREITGVCENLKEFSEILKRKKLAEIIKNRYDKEIYIESVEMDSRKIKKNSLFFAINNGNNFIEEALNKGASLVVSDKTDIINEKVVKVENTILEMQKIAKEYREKLGLKVIGVTGSNGKTTTKDILYSILSKKYSVLKTEGNYNNHIGLPFTLLNITEDKDIAVLEMGMSSLGEIDKLCQISKPNYAVITNIGESHLEYLKTKENIFRAKTEILKYVEEENVFVCGDDEYLKKLESMKVGFGSNNDIQIKDYSFSNLGSKFIINSQEYTMNLLGKHNILNAAIAISLSKKLDLEENKIKNALKRMSISKMRFQEIKIGQDIYINDAYNASLTSMKAAIDTINSIYNGKYKIAVLGDILETGEEEIKFHVEILEYLLNKNIKLIYLYGERMKKAYGIFMKERDEEYRFWYYSSIEEIVESLKNIRMQKIILLKASRGMKLEKIIELVEKESE